MTNHWGRRATFIVALALLFCASEAWAQRYGVNRTITKTKTVSTCKLTTFSCPGDANCDSTLASTCQAIAPTFCASGDTFISASFGGTLGSTTCSVNGVKPSPLCLFETFTHYSGTANCAGSCNALCERSTTECIYPSDCLAIYGDPHPGTWECWFGQCILTNSPLVLHLPDYLEEGGFPQSWWKDGFCGADSPTVCLDWRGDGKVSCSAWFEPGSENAFVVDLSDDDLFALAASGSVRAETWRHFFGNVTQGPAGDFPYEHGFAALAAHCDQDPSGASLDLTGCAASLFAWSDGDGDGDIELEELVDFRDLGIEALGKVRKTGKKDRCGNAFRFESHAQCADGQCGTVLDVFFERR